MELPELGSKCHLLDCQRLDFLPLCCKYCKHFFCRIHFQPHDHRCPQVFLHDKLPSGKRNQNVMCTMDGCQVNDLVEMLCVECNMHFCLLHRYHTCFNINEEQVMKARDELTKTQQHNQSTIRGISDKIEEGLEKSKKNEKTRATALKVQLMRLKGKAKGDSSFPASERTYLLVYLPKRLQLAPAAIYVSNQWSLGRVIDSISMLCNVTNKNNIAAAEKLRLFRKADGNLIATDMSLALSSLIASERVCNGDSLILEYVRPDQMDLCELPEAVDSY